MIYKKIIGILSKVMVIQVKQISLMTPLYFLLLIFYQYTLNEEETEITFTLNKPSYTGNKSEEVVMKYTIEKKDNEYLLTLISDSSEYFEKGFTIILIPQELESTS